LNGIELLNASLHPGGDVKRKLEKLKMEMVDADGEDAT